MNAIVWPPALRSAFASATSERMSATPLVTAESCRHVPPARSARRRAGVVFPGSRRAPEDEGRPMRGSDDPGQSAVVANEVRLSHELVERPRRMRAASGASAAADSSEIGVVASGVRWRRGTDAPQLGDDAWTNCSMGPDYDACHGTGEPPDPRSDTDPRRPSARPGPPARRPSRREFAELLREIDPGLADADRHARGCSPPHRVRDGALEAAVVNTLSPGDRVLVVSIGSFGERFAQIAAAFGAAVDTLAFDWGAAADPAILRDRLRAADPYRAVLLRTTRPRPVSRTPLRGLAEVVRGAPGTRS